MADAAAYDPYTFSGLDQAKGLMGKATATQPSYVSSQAKSPTQVSYYDYTPTAPMATINAPNYQMSAGDYKGLMGGDYNALQTALTTPGANAAQTAYNQGSTNLANTMGGRGLYGSSIMQQQQTQGLDSVYQQALADNAAKAAAQRYGMQQQDLAAQNAYGMNRENALNTFNQQGFQTGVGQNKDLFTTALANAENTNTYNANKTNWNQTAANNLDKWTNNQAYEKYLYDQQQAAYQNQSDETLYNRALAMAGLGNQTSTAASNYQLAQQQLAAQREAASAANSTANTSSYLGALGLLGGGLLSKYA